MEMPEAVKRYCDLVENANPDAAGLFVDQVRIALADLLGAAYRIDGGNRDVDPEFEYEMPPEALHEMTAKLSEVIGPRDYYQMVYEPFEDGDIVGAMLTEDMASVWYDLKPGLALMGGPREDNAWFDWWDGVHAHWGRHAVAALYALVHTAYY